VLGTREKWQAVARSEEDFCFLTQLRADAQPHESRAGRKFLWKCPVRVPYSILPNQPVSTFLRLSHNHAAVSRAL
jgi:hypothetical protein